MRKVSTDRELMRGTVREPQYVGKDRHPSADSGQAPAGATGKKPSRLPWISVEDTRGGVHWSLRGCRGIT
jgi:hypothetical protein